MKKALCSFLVSFLLPLSAFAAVPQVSVCAYNVATFNPELSSVTITVSASESVKFNTIAICHADDSVCSRSTAVKYFTNTSTYSESVVKEWDGKTGGSSPTFVSPGQYKIRSTLANQAGESNSPGEYCSANITVDFFASGSDSSTPPTSSGTSTTATSTSSAAGGSVPSSSLSSHSDPEPLGTLQDEADFSIGAGRERLSLVGSSVLFRANFKGTLRPDLFWSFGDGSRSSGAEVEHVYHSPGTYEVVLSADSGNLHGTARTKVRVIEPDFVLSEVDGGVRVENRSQYEANLFGWELTSGSSRFSFPRDTILAARASVVFSSRVTALSSGNAVELRDPRGQTVERFAGSSVSAVVATSTGEVSVPVLSPEEVAEVVQKITYLKSEVARIERENNSSRFVSSSPSRVSVLSVVDTKEPEEMGEKKSEPGTQVVQTASVVSSDSGVSLWKRFKYYLADFF